MIDGFGWFEEGDYRRAFLLFDHVDYLFPSDVQGPLWYPPSVFESAAYSARSVASDLGEHALAESVARDLAEEGFRKAAAKVPPADRHYARNVVTTDPELSWLLKRHAHESDEAALSLLSSKLLACAARAGSMPIVGREYAWEMLTAKLRLGAADLFSETAAEALATPEQQVVCSVLTAGLSMAFLDGEALTRTPFEALASFKAKNARLLERHQLSLVDAAQAFAGLPSDADLKARIAKLRTEAQRERLAMETEAEEAWLAAGLKLGQKAAIAAASGALPLVAFLRNATIPDLLAAALPAAGLALAGALGAADKVRRARAQPAAYLFQARSLVDQHWVGARRPRG